MGAELFISCHVNNAYDSYNGSLGCEVIHHRNSSNGKDYATKVEKQLASIGFKSRGAKEDTRGLAEIKGTNCPCIIVEPFFVEATEDVATYNSVGDKGIANAIVKGITGQDVIKKEPTEGYIQSNYLQDYVYCYQNSYGDWSCNISTITRKIPDIDVFPFSNTTGPWFETQWMRIDKCNQVSEKLGDLVYKIITR